MKVAIRLFPTAALFAASASAALPNDFAAVGQQIAPGRVLPGRPIGPCVPTDCEILRPDGSRWTIFGQDITRQRYFRREAGHRMPFGLANVTSKTAVIAMVERKLGVRFMTDDGRYYQAPIAMMGTEFAYVYMVFKGGGQLNEIGVSLGET